MDVNMAKKKVEKKQENKAELAHALSSVNEFEL